MSKARQLVALERKRKALKGELAKSVPAVILFIEDPLDPRLQELRDFDRWMYFAAKDVICPDHYTRALAEPQEEVFI